MSVTSIPPPKIKHPVSAKARASRKRIVVPSSHETKLNRLLGSLPDSELKLWLPDLELIELP
jgi:hypothetical protein